jgi:hypothetical protein
MTPDELAQKIADLIDNSENKFSETIIRIQTRLYNRLTAVLKDLEIDGEGYILQNTNNRTLIRSAENIFDEDFYHWRFPQKDEAMELTSSVLTTSSEKKRQKKLEVLHAPYYLHNKLIDVLRHHSVSIDNNRWEK